MKQKVILANITQLVTEAIKQTASSSDETVIRVKGRRMGRQIALEESVGIELKNKLVPGAK